MWSLVCLARFLFLWLTFEGTPLRLLLIRICSFQNGNDRMLTLSSHFLPHPSSADILPLFPNYQQYSNKATGWIVYLLKKNTVFLFGAIDCDLKCCTTRQDSEMVSIGSYPQFPKNPPVKMLISNLHLPIIAPY